jgi:hypothetical protein
LLLTCGQCQYGKWLLYTKVISIVIFFIIFFYLFIKFLLGNNMLAKRSCVHNPFCAGSEYAGEDDFLAQRDLK